MAIETRKEAPQYIVKYCWRCGELYPFLTEEAYERVSGVYRECIERVQRYREETGTRLRDTPQDFSPVSEMYAKITGIQGLHHNAVIHHRLATLGDDCESCGKPLRTPRAKMCAACGHRPDLVPKT